MRIVITPQRFGRHEEKTDGRKQKAGPLFQPDSQGPHHVMNNNGLAPDKDHHSDHSGLSVPGNLQTADSAS